MIRSRRFLVRAAVVFAAWTAFGLLLAEQTQLQLQLRGQVRPYRSVLAPALFAAWLWALFTPLVVALTNRVRHWRARRRLGWPAYLAAHAALAVALTLVGTWLWTYVRPLVDGVVQPWPVVLSNSLLIDSASYVAVATMAEAAAYAAQYREREHAAAALARTAAELSAQLEEARLHALEAQLRPHFLYNTLNLVAELVHDEPEAADAMLTRLGLLLRRTYTERAHLVPLADELSFVAAYADILRRRFGERATLAVDVPPELRALEVPAFSLQPLVENAFHHGAARREGGTAVELTARLRDGRLVLTVRDHGVPVDDVARHRPRASRAAAAAADHAPGSAHDGVGMGNTRARLAALYGNGAGLTLARTGADETTATLWLPSSGAVVPLARPAGAPTAGAPAAGRLARGA
jgi:sensor histidine kinase YesM